jgi:hypothetical protein
MTEHRTRARRWPDRFRLVGAVVLAIAFFLPLSSCSNSTAFNQEGVQAVSVDAETGAVTEGPRRYRYPFKSLAMDDPEGLLVLVAFFWPTLAFGYRKFNGHKVGVKFTTLEFLLCFLTIWFVWSVSFLERLEIGGYLAFGGATLCLAAASALLLEEIRRWRIDRKPQQHIH